MWVRWCRALWMWFGHGITWSSWSLQSSRLTQQRDPWVNCVREDFRNLTGNLSLNFMFLAVKQHHKSHIKHHKQFIRWSVIRSSINGKLNFLLLLHINFPHSLPDFLWISPLINNSIFPNVCSFFIFPAVAFLAANQAPDGRRVLRLVYDRLDAGFFG